MSIDDLLNASARSLSENAKIADELHSLARAISSERKPRPRGRTLAALGAVALLLLGGGTAAIAGPLLMNQAEMRYPDNVIEKQFGSGNATETCQISLRADWMGAAFDARAKDAVALATSYFNDLTPGITATAEFDNPDMSAAKQEAWRWALGVQRLAIAYVQSAGYSEAETQHLYTDAVVTCSGDGS